MAVPWNEKLLTKEKTMSKRRRSKRRWFQFSLRSLLLVTFVFALMLGWLRTRRNEGRLHERVAVELQSLGCSSEFSHYELVKVPGAAGFLAALTGRTERQSTLPSLVEKLGLDPIVRRIRRVRLRTHDPKKLQSALLLLKDIDALESVSFCRSGVVDEKQLADLFDSVAVGSLYIHNEKLPRTRMSWLDNENLTWLCVARTQFSNPAIDDLPLSLTYFDATRTRINDEGLNGFVRLKNLKTLWLRRTPTTEEAIEALRRKMPWCAISWEPLERP